MGWFTRLEGRSADGSVPGTRVSHWVPPRNSRLSACGREALGELSDEPVKELHRCATCANVHQQFLIEKENARIRKRNRRAANLRANAANIDLFDKEITTEPGAVSGGLPGLGKRR